MINNFKESLKVEKIGSTDRDIFEKKYLELLTILKNIDFEKINSKDNKVNLQNYKLENKDNNDKAELSDEEVEAIIDRIKLLSSPKYLKYLKEKEIPNRSTKPNFSGLSEKERAIKESNYSKQLADEEKNIRLFTNNNFR